jgi:hypothetical protein
VPHLRVCAVRHLLARASPWAGLLAVSVSSAWAMTVGVTGESFGPGAPPPSEPDPLVGYVLPSEDDRVSHVLSHPVPRGTARQKGHSSGSSYLGRSRLQQSSLFASRAQQALAVGPDALPPSEAMAGGVRLFYGDAGADRSSSLLRAARA